MKTFTMLRKNTLTREFAKWETKTRLDKVNELIMLCETLLIMKNPYKNEYAFIRVSKDLSSYKWTLHETREDARNELIKYIH